MHRSYFYTNEFVTPRHIERDFTLSLTVQTNNRAAQTTGLVNNNLECIFKYFISYTYTAQSES